MHNLEYLMTILTEEYEKMRPNLKPHKNRTRLLVPIVPGLSDGEVSQRTKDSARKWVKELFERFLTDKSEVLIQIDNDSVFGHLVITNARRIDIDPNKT